MVFEDRIDVIEKSEDDREKPESDSEEEHSGSKLKSIKSTAGKVCQIWHLFCFFSLGSCCSLINCSENSYIEGLNDSSNFHCHHLKSKYCKLCLYRILIQINMIK